MESASPVPEIVWVVRHGQSAGNVARDLAEAAGTLLIDIADRDADVDLSAAGKDQARALGKWFANQPPEKQPSIVLCSPYIRARRTAELLMTEARLDPDSVPLIVDERLREKEFGVLDRYTVAGIRHHFPDLAKQRAHVGKFYFRPPGGESWCDVILRLRSAQDTWSRAYAGERVLIVSHQVIVNCLRYLLEQLDEHKILAIDKQGDVPNCALTTYRYDRTTKKRGGYLLQEANFVVPLDRAGAEITTEPDAPVAAKP